MVPGQTLLRRQSSTLLPDRLGEAVSGDRRPAALNSNWAKLVGILFLGLCFPVSQLSAQTTPPADAPPSSSDENRALPASSPMLASPPQLPGPTEAAPSGSFSITSPDRLADWQRKLTLGPGDVLNISLYGQLDSVRPGLFIGPDGRLTYLQAQDIEASGLTVDELRGRLETVLAKYYLAPRVIIIPAAYNSKKYCILGNVNQKGVYQLDHPVTIIEAIAKAKGFMNSFEQRNTLLLADLSRSFLIRKTGAGQFEKVNIDFEALFLRGDLSQNKALAPDDYLYFPPLDLQEVYVLGEVLAPGISPFVRDLTAIRAITSRGGFTNRAYKRKILVIRGSLSQPRTFIVNVSDILAARAPDFRLEARDIIYVSRDPWSKVEDLLQMALSSYTRAIVVAWTGRNVGPITDEPFVPNIK
ncbi:MAG: SLBB domain-containing protein [Candidatus Omnitrophica bacterium]|nr:SLBB domain-containing protein [Candidatus Omnitrophota bacterium]